MSYDERDNRTYSRAQASRGIAMGMLYLIMGGVVVNARYFGSMALSSTYAYILGGLLIAYGGFRIYRGVRSMNVKKRR